MCPNNSRFRDYFPVNSVCLTGNVYEGFYWRSILLLFLFELIIKLYISSLKQILPCESLHEMADPGDPQTSEQPDPGPRAPIPEPDPIRNPNEPPMEQRQQESEVPGPSNQRRKSGGGKKSFPLSDAEFFRDKSERSQSVKTT